MVEKRQQIVDSTLGQDQVMSELTEIAKDERGVFWQIPETSLARAAEIAGDEAKSRKAHADFSAIWKDADVELPITSLKELL